MRPVRAALFMAIFYVSTLAHVLAGMVASLFGTEEARAVIHNWANFHNWTARKLLGIRAVVEGEIPAGPHLIAVKHQSMYETVEMLRVARTPVVVMKRQLTDMPLFGWMAMRYGAIPVDREAGAKALRQMLALGKAAVAAERPVLIFPEGTRVPAGETPPLRAGFAGLYRALGLPVVPVAVDSGRLGGSKKSGTIRFRVGEVIEPGLKRAEIEQRVHAAINALETSAAEPRP